MPKVAILSAVETVTPKLRSAMDAAALSTMAERGRIAGSLADRSFAFVNVVSIAATKTERIHFVVASDSHILVPNLESGTTLARQLEYVADVQASGILLGATFPVELTSRADPAHLRISWRATASLWSGCRQPKDSS